MSDSSSNRRSSARQASKRGEAQQAALAAPDMLERVERSHRNKTRTLALDNPEIALAGATIELANFTRMLEELAAKSDEDLMKMTKSELISTLRELNSKHQDSVAAEAARRKEESGGADSSGGAGPSNEGPLSLRERLADKITAQKEANARTRAEAQGMTDAERDVHVAEEVERALAKQTAAAEAKQKELQDKLAAAEAARAQAEAAREEERAARERAAQEAAEQAAREQAQQAEQAGADAAGPSGEQPEQADEQAAGGKRKRKTPTKEEFIREHGQEAWDEKQEAAKKTRAESKAKAKETAEKLLSAQKTEAQRDKYKEVAKTALKDMKALEEAKDKEVSRALNLTMTIDRLTADKKALTKCVNDIADAFDKVPEEVNKCIEELKAALAANKAAYQSRK